MPASPILPDVDVAVVGGGYTGLSAALTLAQAGRSVQVFEAGRIGEGASSRNGGITSGSLRYGLAEAIRRLGTERGTGIHREGIAARAFLRDLIAREGIACDQAREGHFSGAITPRDHEDQKRAADQMNRTLGTDLRIIPKEGVPAHVGSGRYLGGLFNPDIGTIHPAKYVLGLWQAALRAGATVHGATRVEHVRRERSGFRIHTPRGPCRAAAVIVATNGYSGRADPWLRRRIVPVNSRIVVTAPLPGNLITALAPTGAALGEVRHLIHYFRRTPDGKRILLGAREPTLGGPADKAAAHVRRGLVQIFPELTDIPITHSWAGRVAFSRCNLPRLFERAGVLYACGYCGSGTVWATWLGHKAALRVLGDPAAHTWFDGAPPPAVPLYAGHPWFLPAPMLGYRLADWLKGRA